ncbi:MAG: glycosyltransferase family 2 protein [Flavobacteriales bacterium]|jgi:teichuronic acid biosynthesis glycosyltransferase TuaG|nr:glycosyltransferase family 2 protein [Flavobacteriales bacterium]
MNNLVSIITPSFNSSKYIKETVDSVLRQTYENWELIIVDDGSKDSSANIIQDLTNTDTRIKGFYFDKNIGAAEARNVAIQQAKGKYIAFLDSNDLWELEKLEKQISFMQTEDIAFSFSTYQPMSEDGSKLYSIIHAPKIVTYSAYLKNTIIGCLTVVIDREKAGDFEMPNIRSSHDMALWLLIMKRGFDAYGLDENLARYRIVSASNTSSKWRAAKDVWKIYREVEKLSFLYSSWCFLNYAFNALVKRI